MSQFNATERAGQARSAEFAYATQQRLTKKCIAPAPRRYNEEEERGKSYLFLLGCFAATVITVSEVLAHHTWLAHFVK